MKEEGKSVEEAKYGAFGRPFQGNGGRYRVGPARYYTRYEKRSPFREKKPSLEETINKCMVEPEKRQTESEEFVKKLKENTDYLNLRNQVVAIKNLETQIGQIAKDVPTKILGTTPSLSEANLIGQVKEIMKRSGFDAQSPFIPSYDHTNVVSSAPFVSK